MALHVAWYAESSKPYICLCANTWPAMQNVHAIRYSVACRMFMWAAAPLAMLAIMSSAFGPEGMTMCVGQAALSVLMLEAANYVQHYGLQRCRLPTGR